MNIVVVLRLMPNFHDEPGVDTSGTDIDREQVSMVINEFDDQALEETVLLKEATSATAIAVALRVEGIEQVLRVAFARGVDRVVVVEAGDVDAYDSRTAARALAQALGELEADLVLTGVQTPYDLFGQMAPNLAVALGWPQVSVVSGVSIGDGAARVKQEYAGGRMAMLDVRLPAVVGVQSATSPPRYVSMNRLRQAMTGAISESVTVRIEAPPEVSRIVSLVRPEPSAGVTMLGGDSEELAAQIAALLREQDLVN
jgi:electron transfer flavoprotein beta subunit